MQRQTKKKNEATIERVSYVRVFDGAWPGVNEWIEVVVEPREMGGWWAYGSTGLPTKNREQWNTRKTFVELEDAARFAAEYLEAAEAIVAAILRGESPRLPHVAMRAACAESLRSSLALKRLRARNAPSSEIANAQLQAESDWYRANDWRDFRDAPASKTASYPQISRAARSSKKRSA